MADTFDANALAGLLQNPAFLAGISILTGDQRKGAGANGIAGLQAASALQSQGQQRQILASQLARQQSQANFDPTQYLRGSQTTEPMGADVQGPPTSMLTGQRMEPTGTVRTTDDMRGLLAGATKAGFGMNDIAGIMNALSPKKDLTVVPAGASVTDGSGQILTTAPNAAVEAKPPTVRQNIVGNQIVSQQWDPDAKSWVTVGSGPRWQDPKESLVEISDPTSPTGTRMVPQSQAGGAPGLKLQAKDKPAGAGKTLPAQKVESLSKVDTGIDSLTGILNSFKPEYGGYKSEMLGDLDNQMKQKFGDKTGQAGWWQDVDRNQTALRKELFGSQLTKYEGTQFDKFKVHSGQDPDVITRNLQKQQELATSASKKLKEYYGKAGFDMTGFGGEAAPEESPKAGKTVVQTGTDKATGRKVFKYSDGSVGYGN